MRIRPKKDRSPLTKLQRFEYRQEKMKNSISSDSRRYRFRNKSNVADLGLPKPAEDGRTAVGLGGEFIGDGYFVSLVPEFLVIVENLTMKNESKLITEQPPIVTNEGKVEYVQQQKQQKLNEGNPDKQEDVLLTEDPIGGVVIFE